jgi:hypothetical protein
LPAPLLTILKYVFLAVLYLFFLRVLRAVWVELREPKVVADETLAPSPFAEAFETPVPAARRPASDHAMTTATATVVAERLQVTAPPERSGISYPLADEVTVGRAPGCGIALPDDTFVSQLHARVFRRDGAWWVEDLGSTNGTFVDGAQVAAPVVVRRGEKLQFGQTVMELRS